jgi:predicted PurR-regulated permease PerM
MNMPGAPRILLQMNSIFRVRFAWYLVAAAVAGILLYLVAPILSPFLFAATLAYICLPLVDRLAKKMPRRLAASIVLVLLLLGLSLLVLIVAPMVERQFSAFLQNVPDYLDWVRERFLPWLSSRTGVELHLDLAHAKQALADSLRADNDVLKSLLPKLTTGGAALIGFFTAVLLVPVMLFYFLRDWHDFLHRIEDLIPRRSHQWAVSLAEEINRVLGECLRGQISVILIMCAYYVLGLWMAGLEYSLPIGILSGLLVFVPYLGALVGLLLATLAGINQFDSVFGLAGVWVVFGVGQSLEGFVVTPWLVGNRIGLHPVAVIFALLVFGHLFGFFGVLLALPASAALLVGLRHLRAQYLASDLYKS